MADNNKKVACAICGYKSHILLPHLRREHNMTPIEYQEQNPENPWYSDTGLEALRARRDLLPKLPPTARRSVRKALSDVLPFGSDIPGAYEVEVDVYERTPLVPAIDPGYLFPEQETLELLTLLEKPTRNNVFIGGLSGTGKTTLPTQLAAYLGRELYAVNGDSNQGRYHLIGKDGVANGATFFQYGVVPRAMQAGAWLLINELDRMLSETVNILKPVLQDKQLTIQENGGEVITAAPGFRCIATNNTMGRGDDSGQFVNSQVQDIADLRRWNGFIEMNYIPAVLEEKILLRNFPEVAPVTVPLFVKVVNDVRAGFARGEIGRTLSPAETVNWCENYLAFGNVHQAARISFLRNFEPEVKVAVLELINRYFGHEAKAE